MAKSARSSAIKKNKSGLKKRVFGPIESARNERLNAKLLELASQPKPPREEIDVEPGEGMYTDSNEAPGEQEALQDVELPDATEERFSRSERNVKNKQQKAARIQKSSRKKKPRNNIIFAKTGKAKRASKR